MARNCFVSNWMYFAAFPAIDLIISKLQDKYKSCDCTNTSLLLLVPGVDSTEVDGVREITYLYLQCFSYSP